MSYYDNSLQPGTSQESDENKKYTKEVTTKSLVNPEATSYTHKYGHVFIKGMTADGSGGNTTSGSNEKKNYSIWSMFCNALKILMTFVTFYNWLFYTNQYITLKAGKILEKIMGATMAGYVIYIFFMLGLSFSNDPSLDIPDMIFNFVYGSSTFMIAISVQPESSTYGHYHPEISFSSLGMISYIYAGFFLLYPKLMPDRSESVRLIREGTVIPKEEEPKAEGEALFIIIPLRDNLIRVDSSTSQSQNEVLNKSASLTEEETQ